MKKKTFYTLLCTSIILPGTLLAADGFNTPIRLDGERKKQQLLAGVKSKEALTREQQLKYESVVLSPDTKSDYVARGTAQAVREQSAEIRQKLQEVDVEVVQKRLARDLALEEERRAAEKQAHEDLIRRAQADKLENEVLIAQAQEDLRLAQEAVARAQQEAAQQNQNLDRRIAELTTQVEGLNTRLSAKADSQRLSREEIDALSLELETKTQELTDAQKELLAHKAKADLLEQQVKTEREGKERLLQGLKDKVARAAEGGVQPPVVPQPGALPLGGGQPPVVPQPGALPLGGVQPPVVPQPGVQPPVLPDAGQQPADGGAQKKQMKKANFGAQGGNQEKK